jgi:hypothetical protein
VAASNDCVRIDRLRPLRLRQHDGSGAGHHAARRG